MALRAVIYARYSSESQNESSIADQIRLCKERIAAQDWTLVDVYRDAAISGATTVRPGYQALIEDARNATFDVIVAEALDRLSRDQEDVAALYKHLTFAGVTLLTLAEELTPASRAAPHTGGGSPGFDVHATSGRRH